MKMITKSCKDCGRSYNTERGAEFCLRCEGLQMAIKEVNPELEISK